MKRILIVAFFMLTGACCFGQINFRLYGYDPCLNKVRNINFFGLKKGDTIYTAKDSTGILILLDSGVYTLSYVIDEIDTTVIGKEYHLSEKGSYNDTLRFISIFECLEGTGHKFIGYCYCFFEKCNGRQVDYYQNGHKRIEGVFRDGHPTGNVFLYYPTGQIMEIRKYRKNGTRKKVKKFTLESSIAPIGSGQSIPRK